MNAPRTDSHSTPLRAALDHAQRLTDHRAEASAYSTEWSAQAAHVGDLTVLMLAMRG
jgi:hypothetical protein